MRVRTRWLLAAAIASVSAALARAQAPPLGPEFQANTYTTSQQTSVSVASAGDGSFVAAWVSQDQDGSGLGVFAQRFDGAGSKVGAEFRVNSFTAGDQAEPSVAANAAGDFLVVWTSQGQDGSDAGIFGQRFDGSGAKVGPEFQVNTYTTGGQSQPSVAMDAAGNFLVAWSSSLQDGSGSGVFGQRYDSSGAKVGAEFLVNTYTTGSQSGPAVAATRSGDFIVVWTSALQDGSGSGVFGQRVSGSGSRIGPEFAVNGFTTGDQVLGSIAAERSGGFVVVWDSAGQDGSGRGVFGQRFNSSAEKIGPEFPVNSYTAGDQFGPSVETDRNGDFLVVWTSDGQDGSQLGIFGQRFARDGSRVGSEFAVNTYTASDQSLPKAVDAGLGPVILWTSAGQVGASDDIFGRRQIFAPLALAVDARGIGSSDANGVLEPGEKVAVDPEWTNQTDASQDLEGNAVNLSGPAGPIYAVVDPSASYGSVAPDDVGACANGAADACYSVEITGARPSVHWDTTMQEETWPEGSQFWKLHVGDSFTDVPRTQLFYNKIETVLHAGITSGCGGTLYCPGSPVARDQMAIFIAKGIAGSGEYVPATGTVSGSSYNCSGGGNSLFADVSPSDVFCRHVHYLAAQNVTLGCNPGNYCPTATVTREAMASFIAKAIVAPGGGNAVPVTFSQSGRSYSCDAGSPNVHFTDVPASSPFCKHIHYLWARGIVSGCSATQYCPTSPVNRDAMAKFIANGFGLRLYGPSDRQPAGGSDQPPTVNAGPDQAITQTGVSTEASLSGSASDDGLPNPPAALTYQWSQVSGPTPVTFTDATALSTTVHLPEAAVYVLRLTASDGLLSSSDDVTINVNPVGGVPPDPGTLAPPVSPGVATDLADSTQFLYTGPGAIQTGVADGTIDRRRSAVARGRVLTRDGTPLSGVRITILSHPELGQTLSRADGMFDMAVNGGGLLTFRYEKSGLLPAQRQIAVPWRDFVFLPDVTLVAADSRVTTIDMNSAVPFQVARSNPVTDADGTRQATVLFAAGTTAGLVQPDGSLVPAAHLNVRLTEYTVGASGPNAMPGELPPTSFYTYATELGADEAVAKVNGRDVVFNKPVILYTENFLNIPVGEVVPAGYYDPALSAWVGSPNGHVIKVVGKTAGLADLDLNGDGVADGAAALAALGISDAERQQLANLYASGTSLWRTPLDHFSTIDTNWPAICDGACGPPKEPPPPPPNQCQDTSGGSIIGCERQTLGEDVPLAGTPYSLHYESDRVPGRTAEQSLLLALGTRGVPDGVQGIQLEVLVAGQKLSQTADKTTASTTVTWDGKDAYGRPAQGSQRVTVRIGYTYKMIPASAGVAAIAWARLSGIPMSGSRARADLTLWQEWTGTITRWDNRALGLGGWSLSALHAYDPVGQVLNLGDGTRRDASTLSAGPIPAGVISTIAGKTPGGFGGDGGPATDARFRYPYGLAVGPDGSLYIADSLNHRVRRVGPDGIITTVAGNGTAGFAGDNGPATSAELNTALDVAIGPDGSLFIVDQLNYRIRQVRPDGTIVTLAGNGQSTFGGDGGPATAAGMQPFGVAAGPDGSVYIADRSNSRVRMVDRNGLISTVAGNGLAAPNQDGVPATSVNLGVPSAVAVGPDGSLFIVVGGPGRVRRVSPQGLISTITGTTAGFSGDGGPAELAQISAPLRLAVGPDGSIYIPDLGNQRVRWIGSEGIITTVAGTGLAGFSGDGGLATKAQFSDPYAVAVGPDGSLYVADSFNQRIRRVASALPGSSLSDILLPSADGSEVYVFSGAGRHLQTLDALTGAVRAQFTYDSADRLLSVDDGDGNVTTVERDPSTGDPTAIVAPFGQQTTLTLDANGFLSGIKDPANKTIGLTSTATGLLTTLTDRRGGIYKFSYDALGRLTRDEDPAGGIKTLARAESPTGSTVSVSTALGRTTTYQTERLVSGALSYVITEPGGVQTELLMNTDGSRHTTYPDGRVEVEVPGADPRWGLQAPILASFTRSTPGGLTETITGSRTATLASANDPLSLVTQTDTQVLNGRTWTTVYQAAGKTLTSTSPAGRQITRTLDARGRVVQQQVTGLFAETFAYDGHGRLVSDVEGTGGGARTTTLAYNPEGFLATLTNPLGQASSFTYDALGRVASMTLPGPRTATFGHDASGNLTALTPPGAAAHAIGYTAVDLIASYTPPALPAGPTPTAYTYDVDRQLTRLTRPDATHVDLGYDTAGRLGSVTLPGGTLAFGYDSASRLASLSAPGAPTLAFSYDGDLATGAAASAPVAGSVGATYDTTFRLASVDVNGASSVGYVYDVDGLMTAAGSLSLTRSAQNGLLTGSTLGVVTDTWTYSGFGEPTAYSASANANPVFSGAYTRDALGRITTLVETIGGVADTYDYTYDSAGRLVVVKKNGTAVETYTYDANGNRTSFTGTSGTQPASYDAQDRLTQYKGNTYTYTTAGELQAKGVGAVVTTYNYDPLGNLLGATLTSGKAITYLVDGRQRRVGKKVNGTLVQGFLYQDGLRPIAELDGAGTLVSRFVYDTSRPNVPAYLVKGGVTYRIITDPMGSVRLVLDTATGQIAQRMDYDAFGQVLADTAPGFQPFGFAGGLYDRDTKLVRFGARDYDPEAGRWTTKDPVGFSGGDANLYAYAANDPVNASDPTGLDGQLLQFDETKFAEDSGKKIAKKVACKKLNVPGLNNPKANKEREDLDKISKEGEKGTWSLWESIKSVFSGFGK